jgi:type I restriction enzyme, S subunit
VTVGEWHKSKLVDVAAKKRWALNGGPFGSKLSTKHYTESGVPVIRGTNLSGYSKFSFADFVYVSEEKADELRPNNAHPGDLVFTQRGTIGQVGLIPLDSPIPRFVISQSQMKLTPDPEQAESSFLYYYFLAPNTVQKIQNLAFAAGVPHINLEILRNFEVPLPPLPVQRRIAGILSAYDDLIENNHRRIKILEEMARSLYREWFVHFRFPGHDKVKMVSSPLGPIPQGWGVKPMPKCVDINPRIAVLREGENPFVPMGSLANDSMLIANIEARVGNSGAKFQNGDTLFARITPCLENGKTGFVQFLSNSRAVACGSTEFIVLRSRSLTPEFVYLLGRSEEFRSNAIKSMSGASGRQRVQEKCFEGFLITQPPHPLLDHFSAIVAPSFRLIQKLHLKVQNLRRTRDLLLSRLLSGQLELKAI